MTDQTTFRQALLDPSRATPDGLEGPAKAPANKRYDVYRNNVTHSLIAALQTAFPMVRKILGSTSFDALAPLYVRAHPPTSPIMMLYGVDFPEFLKNQPQFSKLGYLPDCARFDLALRSSYHAADAAPFDLAAFQNLPPDEMMAQHLPLAPATRILKSRWPLFDIWRFNMVAGAPKPRPVPQDVMITRAQFDPEPHLLPQGAAGWLGRLAQGDSIEAAHDATVATMPEFDLAATLVVTLSNTAFCNNKVR